MSKENMTSFIAEMDIPAHSFVKFGTSGGVTLATSSTDDVIGVSDDVLVHSGNPIDVLHLGVGNVTYGGTVASGKKITSNKNGQAIVAEAGDNIFGLALVSATEKQIGLAILSYSNLAQETTTPSAPTE